MAWNLSGLIIILFFVNQSIAILLFGSNIQNEKLCIGAISMKTNKSLIERLNKIGQSIVKPCGTLEKILS